MIQIPSTTPTAEDDVDTYLVDQVLQQSNQSHLGDISLQEQLSAMKIEVQRLAESLALLADGTAAIARQAPAVLANKAEQQIQVRPISTIVAVALLSYTLTRLMLGER